MHFPRLASLGTALLGTALIGTLITGAGEGGGDGMLHRAGREGKGDPISSFARITFRQPQQRPGRVGLIGMLRGLVLVSGAK